MPSFNSRWRRRAWLGLALALFTGCGGRSQWRTSADGSEIVRTARTQLGKPYHYGGTSPRTGFDCSGFTGWVFARHGINLPREVAAQYHQGRRVDKDDLEKGDLVFFNIGGGGPSHVGIYAGDGYFIHSPSTGGRIRSNSLAQQWWAKRFVGARRVTQ